MSNLSPEKKSEKKHGKTDLRHWRDVIYRPALSAHGTSRELPQFYVKLQFKSRREAFPLQTNNLEDAAGKPKAIYLSLVASGWEAALKEHKPRMFKV